MTDVQIDVTRSGDASLVRITGVLDFAAAVRLRLTLFDQLDAEAVAVTVDLSGVGQVDTAAAGVLVQAQQLLAHAGGDLQVVGAHPAVRDAIDTAGPAAGQPVRGPRQRPAAPAGTGPETPRGPTRHGIWGDEINRMISTMARLPESDPARRTLRTRVVEACLPHAHRLARRFAGHGEPPEDLNQVAALGLVKAVDGFDPRFAADFAAYATPTIVGEIKRHFRDRGWSIRVPRRLQELRLDINKADAMLTQRLGRSPTTDEVAEYLDTDPEQVVEALMAADAYRTTSIDTPLYGDDLQTMADRLGGDDPGFAAIEHREALRPLLAALPPREQQILSLRFYGSQSQTQIAMALGISQMHVSRLLTRTLARLRHGMLTDGRAQA